MGLSFSSSAAGGSTSESSKVTEWRDHFNSIKDSNQLVVLDFTATWCGPCRMMAPILEELSQKFKNVIFFKIDVDEFPDVAREFKVEAMPTFILLKQGKEVDKIVGADKDSLPKKITLHAA